MKSVRKVIKSVLGEVFSKSDRPIVVSSMGRSGSTMLVNSIAESAWLGPESWSSTIVEGAWVIEKATMGEGIVYKTHDYPPTNKIYPKYIYIYSDPFRVISSMYLKYKKDGEEWLRQHAENLKISPKNEFNFLCQDVFRLEDHFDAWRMVEGIDLFMVNLDDLWDNNELLSEYLDFRIKIPEKIERKSGLNTLPDKYRGAVKDTYGSLRERAMSLDLVLKKRNT